MLPTKYKSKHCVDIYKQMAAGLSDTEVMAKWGISRSTFYRWKKEHPEFEEAHGQGKVQFDANHEKLGMEGMLGTKEVDYQFWRDLGKFRHGWTEKTGNTTNTQINIFNEQSDDELLAYIKSKMEEHPELGRIIEHEE